MQHTFAINRRITSHENRLLGPLQETIVKSCTSCNTEKEIRLFYNDEDDWCRSCTIKPIYEEKMRTQVYVGPEHHKPTIRPTTQDIMWAAGFFEGEGSCSGSAGNAQIAQKGRWPLDFMRDRFGGVVSIRTRGYYKWFMSGPRSRGFLMTIYPFLSPRRQEQIRRHVL